MAHAFVLAAIAAAAAAPLSASNYAVDAPMPKPDQSHVLWADEFDGPALDASKWSFDTSRNKAGWWNGEQQYYSAGRPENLRIEDGKLIIEARRDPEALAKLPDWGGQSYSSAKIMTKGKAAWTYGFYEVRAKLPCARGTWPAIWLLPDGGGGWPDGGEIDVLEQVGSQPNVAHATLHTALFNDKNQGRGARTTVPTSCSEFHRYQLAWRPDAITIGVDDRAYMQVNNDQPGGRKAWPFDRPFHVILNLAIGGPWAGAKGIDDAAMPQRFEVDYVRVYALPPG
jgi:beta-glucanase (GH16 family)